MIDLGDELAGYGDDDAPPPPPTTTREQPIPTPAPGGGATVPLADLQAAGFNVDNYAVQHAQAVQRHHDLIRHMLEDVEPLLDEDVEPPDCLKANPSHGTVPGEPIFLGYRSAPGRLKVDIVPIDDDVRQGLGPLVAYFDDEDLEAWGGAPPTSIRRVPPWLKLHTDEGEAGDA